MKDRMSIYDLIEAERAAQDQKYGGPSHDDEHDAWDWRNLINQHANAGIEAGVKRDMTKFQKSMIRVAALAVAAFESSQRKHIQETTHVAEG